MNVIDNDALMKIDINPALDRIRNEIVNPILDAITRVEKLLERVDGSSVKITLGQ